jgi:hypothetical protein
MGLRRTPKLIHPVWIVIEQMDRTNTVFDNSAREPVRHVTRKGAEPRSGDQTRIKAQVSYYFAGGRLDYPMYDRRGVEEKTDGYIAMRVKDMIAAGLATKDATTGIVTVSLLRGDRVVQHAGRAVDLYITGFEDFGHYPVLNSTLLQANFQARHPTHQKGDL